MKISTLRNIKNIKENFSFKLETPISEIALALKDKKIGAVPIVDNNYKLIGIVSERDIVSKLVVTPVGLISKVARIVLNSVSTST